MNLITAALKPGEERLLSMTTGNTWVNLHSSNTSSVLPQVGLLPIVVLENYGLIPSKGQSDTDKVTCSWTQVPRSGLEPTLR